MARLAAGIAVALLAQDGLAWAPQRSGVARARWQPAARASPLSRGALSRTSATVSPDAPAEASGTAPGAMTMPAAATNAWEVHKFGGASLATAELYRTVGDLLVSESTGTSENTKRATDGAIPTMAIVSAMGGMTDLLIKVVDSALTSFDTATADLEDAVARQVSTLRELAPPEIADPIEKKIRDDAKVGLTPPPPAHRPPPTAAWCTACGVAH